jgi:hypothetical protein
MDEVEVTPDAAAPTPMPGLLKTIGILNMLFGGALLLCGLGCLSMTVPAVVRGVPLQIEPQTTQAVFDELRHEQIKTLRELEKAAAEGTERERLKKERLALEAKHPQVRDEIDFPKVNAELAWLGTYLRLDVLSGPILNLLLVVSGIGLILRKNWARVLALATAALKVLRLLALAALLVGSVIPRLSTALDNLLATEMGRQVITQAIERQQAQQGAAPGAPRPSPEEIARTLRGFGTGFATFLACFGSIYPIIVVILLSRPGARAATDAGESDPAEASGF